MTPPPTPPDLEGDSDELDDCVNEDVFSSDGEEVDSCHSRGSGIKIFIPKLLLLP